MPLADFYAASPQFNAGQLKTIRLVFDKTIAGTVVVSNVGLSTRMDPAFLANPVP